MQKSQLCVVLATPSSRCRMTLLKTAKVCTAAHGVLLLLRSKTRPLFSVCWTSPVPQTDASSTPPGFGCRAHRCGEMKRKAILIPDYGI